MTRLILVENFRAMFYAPFYLAHSTGAYAAEGLDIDLQSSPSPDATHRRLEEGTADVMWGGPFRVLKQRDADRDDDTQVFHAVVCRDPFFLIGRGPAPGFRLAGLAGLRFASVSEVPTPWICLAHDLRLAGIDPSSVPRQAGGTLTANASALQAGELDVIQTFQPYAESLLQTGEFHIWHAAANRGPTAYTTLVARQTTLRSRRPEMQAMTRAMDKTLRWIAETPGAVVAPALADYFPDLPPPLLGACIDRYTGLGLWNSDRTSLHQGFDWLRSAMLAEGTIRHGASFEDCVDTGLI